MNGQITQVESAGGLPPTDASEQLSALEEEYAKGRFKNLATDMFGGPQTASRPRLACKEGIPRLRGSGLFQGLGEQ